ncbi:MAG: S-layer homology domain-containing protein [Clostridia bacterium]|nr:S-layer homology domain-containing protein [Clostridia bacterium]
MRRFNRFFLIWIMILMSISTVFATENRYQLVREMTYKNTSKITSKNGFVEVMIGTKDTVQYQKDGDIIINPAPDEIRKDEFGNIFAYYDMSDLRPGNEFRIRIQRTFDLEKFEREISVRTNAEITDENMIYLEPQKNIDSDDADIVAKAKELTYEISSDYKKALALFEFVNTEMEYTTNEAYANKGAISALENKKGVCEEFTTLYVALCRAIGIPARAVEGYKFEEISEEDEYGTITTEYKLINHVWAEIYLEEHGWLPVEPTVIYAPQGTRIAYTEAFCKIEGIEYIATGIYNAEESSRTMRKYIEETAYVEALTKVPDVLPEPHEFSDITEKYAWSEDAINTLYDLNIVKGYTEDEFGPERNISRIEFITMFSRTLSQMGYFAPQGGQVYYHMDYDQTHWSKEEYDFLMRCYHAVDPQDLASMGYYNIANVFGSTLNMNKSITREEVVALMDAFLKYEGTGVDFTDIAKSSFKQSIIKAYESGLINGYPDGTFRPDNPITRAEMAVILNRYIGEYEYVI